MSNLWPLDQKDIKLKEAYMWTALRRVISSFVNILVAVDLYC